MHSAALRLYARLPRAVRLGIVRAVSPTFTVGALCVLEHQGRTLLLRQHHRHGWTLPGGLLGRGETPQVAVARELQEEIGLDVDPGWPVATVVEPRTRRVDVLFHLPVATRPPVHPRGEAVEAAWLTVQEAAPLDEPTAQALDTMTRLRSGELPASRLRPGA
jgi:ADP-ribose pyrophosphatase YjhB (NUDIX family)